MREIEWTLTTPDGVTCGSFHVPNEAADDEIYKEAENKVFSCVDLTWREVTPEAKEPTGPIWFDLRDDGPPSEEDLTLYVVAYRLGCGGPHIGYALAHYGCDTWTTPDHLIIPSVIHYLPVPPLPDPVDD